MSRHLIYILLTICPFISYSQIKITGQVIDVEQNPIEFATVVLLSKENSVLKLALTNEEGCFIIDVDAGNYRLQITYLQNILFEKEAIFTENIDIGTIKVNNSILIDGVEISAKIRSNIKKELGKYVIHNISNSPFAHNKPLIDYLRFVPILYTDNSNEISILNKGAATIFINGRKTEDTSVALSFLKSILAEDIKTIEIITTPDSRFASSSGKGIINIITKKAKNDGFKGAINSTVSQSYFNSQNINNYISYSREKIAATATLSLDNRKGFTSSSNEYDNLSEVLRTQIETHTTSEYKNFIGNLAFDYSLSKKQNIGFQLYTKFSNLDNEYNTINQYSTLYSIVTDSVYTSNIFSTTPNWLATLKGNLNYNIKVDEEGSRFDIEINHYNDKNNVEIYNIFNNNDTTTAHFLQNPDIKTKIRNYKSDFIKVINEDSKLISGISFTQSIVNNNYFFGNSVETQYISDPQRTNIFNYNDYILAGYLNYESAFNEKWEAKAGLRVEYFNVKGKANTTNTQIFDERTYVFPSFSLLFTPNDDHELSIDVGSYICRPTYNQLNPFIYYTSPNSYKKNNSKLTPSLTYEVNFNYSFFDKYTFDIIYEHNKDLFNEFDIILPDNWIMTTTANYGNSNTVYLTFFYSDRFFNGRWNLSAIMNYTYDNTYGRYNEVDMSFEDNQYSFKTKNQIALNYKKDFILSFNYGYSSGRRYVMGSINNLHSLDVSVAKRYKNFNFTIGGYDLLRANLKINDNKDTYNFQKVVDYYKTIYISVNYRFGNDKIRKVREKSDSETDKRLL
jgi:hypothetical protein